MSNTLTDGNFYGLGTHDWIGTVLEYKSQQGQQDGDTGFGIRRRVAIMGYHPSSKAQLPDDRIIFALVALPTTAGSGAAGRHTSVRVSQGDVVMGKFLDGDAKQNPIILHVLGRTKGTIYGTGRFDAKTGFVGSIKKNNLNPNQNGEEAQQFNEDVPQGTISAITKKDGQNGSTTKVTQKREQNGLQPNKVNVFKNPINNE